MFATTSVSEKAPFPASAAATAELAAEAAAGEGYDATKDPNANFNVRFETEADGTGSWYVYNDDNGSKWKVSDLTDHDEPAAKGRNQAVPIAIVLFVLCCISVILNIMLLRMKTNIKI